MARVHDLDEVTFGINCVAWAGMQLPTHDSGSDATINSILL